MGLEPAPAAAEKHRRPLRGGWWSAPRDRAWCRGGGGGVANDFPEVFPDPAVAAIVGGVAPDVAVRAADLAVDVEVRALRDQPDDRSGDRLGPEPGAVGHSH